MGRDELAIFYHSFDKKMQNPPGNSLFNALLLRLDSGAFSRHTLHFNYNLVFAGIKCLAMIASAPVIYRCLPFQDKEKKVALFFFYKTRLKRTKMCANTRKCNIAWW